MKSAAPSGPARTPPTHRADALRPGTMLDGCEILRVVADSHFAIVYLAREPGTERRFAIKEYLPVSLALRSADGRSVALRAPEHANTFGRGLLAFSAEARLFEQRTHPALLRVLRSSRSHGTVYRVMPWLDGDSLLALRRSLPEPPEEAALKRLLFGLLGALQTLHDAGEVHGAVSPGNILVLTDDRPVLLDTDAVARALVADQTRALMAMVNPAFAQPTAAAAEPGAEPGATAEAATGAASGVAADLHALAWVAHFCISGQLPAAGEPAAPLASVLRKMRLRSSRPVYSTALLEAIDAACSDDPARRPSSVAEFRGALSGQVDTARAAAAEGPALAPAVTGPAGLNGNAPDTPSHTAPPTATLSPTVKPATPPRARDERVRYPGERRRRSNRLAWWGSATLAVLTVATVGLVVVKERNTQTLRAEGLQLPVPVPVPAPTPLATAPELAAPAALPERATPRRSGVVDERVAPAQAASAGPVAVATATAATTAAAAATASANAAKLANALAGAKTASAVTVVTLPKLAPAPAAALASAPVRTPAKAPAPAGPANPRAVCGARTEFALYRCMTTECARPRWTAHAECQRLRETDSVD